MAMHRFGSLKEEIADRPRKADVRRNTDVGLGLPASRSVASRIAASTVIFGLLSGRGETPACIAMPHRLFSVIRPWIPPPVWSSKNGSVSLDIGTVLKCESYVAIHP